MRFDRIIISSDDNPKFLPFWPLVAEGWHRFFGDVEVWLALVGTPDRGMMDDLKQHGNVEVYAPVTDVPMPNQSKLARYHLAAQWTDDSVTMINDVDLLPLQTTYVCNLLRQRPPGHLLTVGSELYTGRESGKFTVGYLTAESAVWKRLVNPLGLGWTAWINSFIGMAVHDHKEDVMRRVHHEDPDTFSDESWLRAMLTQNPVPVVHARRDFYPYTARALCRADWRFDPKKLADGTYVEAHLPRPLADHIDKIKPLEDWIRNV